MIHKKNILESFEYRLKLYFPGSAVRLGAGDTEALIVVIQDDHKVTNIAELKTVLHHMGLLNRSFITSINIVDNPKAGNLSILKELLDILQPYAIVASGAKTVAALKDKDSKTFSLARHRGKVFACQLLGGHKIFPVYSPELYAHREGNKNIKITARRDWHKIKDSAYDALARNYVSRWECDLSEAKQLALKEFSSVN
jgi:hypothetical protein